MSFAATGWALFDDPELLGWVESVAPLAREISVDKAAREAWLRHGGTWFAGVNILRNGPDGAVQNGPPLSGKAVEFAEKLRGSRPSWDPAQISVVYPGYPRQDETESDAAHRFRKLRDAAHVDGLLPMGPERRRMMQEPHSFVLGIPLNLTSPDASPMVIYEGSHEIMRRAFADALAGTAVADWANVDLTEIYQAARRRCFEECARVPIHAKPGQAYVIHRLALHGVAPWDEGATAPEEGRMIAYFRPAFEGQDWLSAP